MYRYAWYVVGVLTLLSVFSFLDTYVLALLVSPIRHDLGINDTQMSLLLGAAYSVFYGVFGILLGRLADSWNRRNLIAMSCAAWSLVTAACGLAQTFPQLLALRVALGVGEATLTPAGYSLIADYFPKERLATAMSVFSTSVFLGQGIAVVLGGVVLAFVGAHATLSLAVFGAMHPWQIVFLIVGLPGLALTLLVFTVKEPPRKGATSQERSIPATRAASVPLKTVLRYFLQSKQALICHSVGFALLSATGYTAWGPSLFMRNYHWSAAQTGVVYGLATSIVGVLGVLAGGRCADWLAERGFRDANIRVGLIATLAWFPTGILFPLMPSPWWAVVLLLPTYFFSSVPWGAAAAALQQMVPNPMRGQATGVYRLVVYLISGSVGPLLVGMMTDWAFHDERALKYSLVIVGSLAHLGSAVMLWLCLRYFRTARERADAWTGSPPDAFSHV